MIIRKHLLKDKRDLDPNLTPEHSRIGQLLYFRFEKLGTTLLCLEKKTGLGKCKIRRMFSGSQDWTLSDIMKLCEGLRMEVSELWNSENTRNKT